MAVAASQILKMASGQLNDAEEPRRWPWAGSDVEDGLLDYLNEGIREMFYRRPTIALSMPAPLASVEDAFPYDASLARAALDWVLYRAFGADTESDANQGRSGFHHARFKEAVG